MSASRLVDAQNDLDGMLCGIAVNERSAILTNCPDHIFDLQSMAPDGKRSRILSCGGTCRSSGGALLASSAVGTNLLAIILSQSAKAMHIHRASGHRFLH
jgi:hypothetical protein